MELPELRRHWQAFAESDPLWAILTADDKKGGRWDPAEFFESGRTEVARVLSVVGARVRTGGRALDFGCGVGRVTQALCEHFDECVGVDIAPAMVDQARRFNRHGARCAYHSIESADLGRFDTGTFDFVYTVHVLQHMHPRLARRYVREILRVLRPGGTGVLEITTRPVGRVALLRSWRHRLVRRLLLIRRVLMTRGLRPARPASDPVTGPVMEMYGTPAAVVRRWVARAGGDVVDVFDWDRISGTRSTDWQRRGFVILR